MWSQRDLDRFPGPVRQEQASILNFKSVACGHPQPANIWHTSLPLSSYFAIIPQYAYCGAYGTHLVVTHHIVGGELPVCFQRQRLQATDIFCNTNLNASVHHLAELLKQAQNVLVGGVELLNCLNGQHKANSHFPWL
jgi:hypothetical protein